MAIWPLVSLAVARLPRSAFCVAPAILALACAGTQQPAADVSAPPAGDVTQSAPGALADGEPATLLPVEADDAVWGAARAPVTIVAFLDFECSFCARGFQTLQVLQEEYGPERLRLVVKHLPLEFHPDALPAAVAAQAVRNASGNEAFFKFAARLMANPRALDATSLADYAADVGIERAVYNEQVATESTFRSVVHDLQLAQRLGITGTPAFYVNGALLQGAQPIDSFRELMDKESKAMAARGEQGVAWPNAYAERVKKNLHTSISEQLLARDPAIYRAVIDGSPTLGSDDALVTLVEFSDFECPFCKRARPTVEQLKKKYGSKLRVVFKHLPLAFHTRAKPAAQVADAVYRQRGNAAFWRALDQLFAATDLSEATLVEIGVEAGLSEKDAVAAARATSSDRVDRDASLAADLEANGTPHFFVNGRRITGAQTLSHFEVFIEAALADAEKLRAAGVAPRDLYGRIMENAATPGVPDEVNAAALSSLATLKRPSRGPADAPVVVHVFSDFECPYCRNAERTVTALEERYEGRLRVVWHNLPLPFHERARPAAAAVEEAFAQGGNDAFWKMHAAVFNLDGEEPALTREALEGHARAAGLDLMRFRKALDARSHEGTIVADEEAADTLGIRGTPAFVVGGYLIKGAQPLEMFERVVDRVLEAQKLRSP